MNSSMKGLTAVITGASAGIGQSIAVALSKEGCRVALLARRENMLEDIKKECSSAGAAEVLTIRCDVSSDEDVHAAVKEVKDKFGQVNILVNNAGVSGGGNMLTAKWEDVDRALMINLRGLMLVTHSFLPLMKDTGRGHIINIGSIAGRQTMGGGSDYCATKHGVVGFSKSLFEDVRELNIKVNVINPGFVRTPMGSSFKNVDLEKFIQPEDIADTVVFLCKFPRTGCPVEIEIRPQFSPYTKS
ncbi:putative short chain dehydrogenase [Basidiobolus meristosporus CBS 931.73]|uniref:Putative short chain dehydrogenase n=1 Tax=Basidiobolus meristosporus CBS 931.73 TaxID=1314790 RepID=A0A1Y1Y557_9FUNG|nr:putative short chain dehydrogenase [Basidiobolus meristosporus CBS 931.73]|eukprot:ORX93118.1 putative short chain dehydrogenase [Basidiobolus meristosporus CBS 931.73]